MARIGTHQDEVDEAHEERVHPPPVEAGDGADGHADEHRDGGHRQGDLDVLLHPGHDLGEHVVADGVGAEGVGPRRRVVQVVGDRRVAVLPEVADEDRAEAEQHEDAEAEHGEALVDEAAEDDAELALRLPGQPVGVRARQPERRPPGEARVCMPASVVATCSGVWMTKFSRTSAQA